MTRARAPGKVVLSGAYSVLHGAPAIVSAVSRFAIADSGREPVIVTEEVKAALGAGQFAPWFDASELRDGEHKLGLGSSAAILVASLFALERAQDSRSADQEIRSKVFERALAAHRRAQAGGSGVDVAASTFGGTLGYRLERAGPRVEALALPAGLSIEVWACTAPASTRLMLQAVQGLGAREPQQHDELLEAQAMASEQALAAALSLEPEAFIAALGAQHRALEALGRAAQVPIVSPALSALLPFAEAEAGVLLPAGAGGGDISLFVGRAASGAQLRQRLWDADHRLLQMELSAPGVASL